MATAVEEALVTIPAQPVITIAVSDALARIEAKVDSIGQQMVLKADQAAVHELDTRIRVLETSIASADAVKTALSRARVATWAAVGSLAAACSAIGYMIVITRGR
jgi:hypothetical protein